LPHGSVSRYESLNSFVTYAFPWVCPYGAAPSCTGSGIAMQQLLVPIQEGNRSPFGPRRTEPMTASIIGTGSAVPERVVSNYYFVDELGLDTTPEWIESKTGIVERRYARPEQRASEFATQAAEAALAEASLDPATLDVIVVATSTPDFTMPATACLVQGRLGAERALAFDLSNACAGFVYAFDIAARYLQTGAETALVIGADLGSRLVSPQDRSTSVFFGDGAGAVLLSASGSGRVLASKLYSRGSAAALSVPVGGTMTMDGRAIWDFATDVLPATVRSLCRDAEVQISELDLLVPHQANRNILRAAAEELGLPLARVVVNLHRYGNTLGASIPLALDEAIRARRARPGDRVALVGFGAGLAWGGVLLEV
jgi:3-oxoacyl-[acyl-carrier-protein] synthase III